MAVLNFERELLECQLLQPNLVSTPLREVLSPLRNVLTPLRDVLTLPFGGSCAAVENGGRVFDASNEAEEYSAKDSDFLLRIS